jgi:hypothetical protein
MRQWVCVVGKVFKLFRAAPIECQELVWFNGSDSTSNRAVILSVIRFPEQLVAATYGWLSFSQRREP